MFGFQIVDRKQRVIEKLTAARGELDDAVRIGAWVARYDPVVLPESKRERVLVMLRELEDVIRELEERQ